MDNAHDETVLHLTCMQCHALEETDDDLTVRQRFSILRSGRNIHQSLVLVLTKLSPARSPLDSACLFTTYRNVRLARKHRSFPDKTVLSRWLSRMPILEWQSCLTCLVTVNLPSSRKASYSTSVTWISLHPSSSPYLEFYGLVSSLAKMSPSPLSSVQPYI